ERADIPDDEGAVRILERGIDGLEAFRLEGEHFSLSLPAHEILRGLEQHHVGSELAVLELLLDLLIEHVAESALDRDRKAGKFLLEFRRQRFVVRHRSTGIDHQRFLVLGLGVKLVECFSARRTRKREYAASRTPDRPRDNESGPTHPLHGYSLIFHRRR